MVITTIEALRPLEYVRSYLDGRHPGGNYVLVLDKGFVARFPAYLHPEIEKAMGQNNLQNLLSNNDVNYFLNIFREYLKELNVSNKLKVLADLRIDLIRKAIKESIKDMAITFLPNPKTAKEYMICVSFPTFQEKYLDLLSPEMSRFAKLLVNERSFSDRAQVYLSVKVDNFQKSVHKIEIGNYGLFKYLTEPSGKVYLFDEYCEKLESMMKVITLHNMFSNSKIYGIAFKENLVTLSHTGTSEPSLPKIQKEFEGLEIRFYSKGGYSLEFGLSLSQFTQALNFLKEVGAEKMYELGLIATSSSFKIKAIASVQGKWSLINAWLPRGG